MAGSRFYFQRDDVNSVEQPLIDLGVITPVSPAIAATSIQLKDSDGGKARLVDEALQEIVESMEIQTNNLSLENLALLYAANPPETFVQAAANKRVEHYGTVGRLVRVRENDTNLYNLSAVAGVIKGAGTPATGVLTTIVKSTKTITTSTNLSALAPGDKIIVHTTGLANILNAGTYTVVSATGAGPTAIVVTEEPAADETAITGSVLYGAASAVVMPAAEWEVESLTRGIVRIIGGAVFTTDGAIQIVFGLGAISSGKRLVMPQSLTGTLQGEGTLVYGRDGNARQTAREFRCSITPASAQIQTADFSSITLSVKVLESAAADGTFGRLIQFYGSLPSAS